MAAFVFFIIFFGVILPKIREGSTRRTPYGKEHKAQWGKAHYDRYAPMYAEQNAAYGRVVNDDSIQDMKPAVKKKRSSGRKKKKDPLFKRLVFGGVAGISGALLTAVCGATLLTVLSELLWRVQNGFFMLEDLIFPIAFGFGTYGSWLLSKKGFGEMNRVKRFRLYEAIIGKRSVCPVADIARSSGRKKKDVIKDLEDMVRRGYFPLGFVDEETSCYYASNKVWREKNPERAKYEDAAGCEPNGQTTMKPENEKAKPQKEEPRKTKAESGKAEVSGYMESLKQEMLKISDEEIAAKAGRLCNHAGDILAWVQLHPECAEDVRRFCSYYLPTATRLLKTYNEVAPHTEESKVAASIENEVSSVLDTMIEAFRGLMDHLLQNTAVDMQAEISALETVLTQEGLVGSDFVMPLSGEEEKPLACEK